MPQELLLKLKHIKESYLKANAGNTVAYRARCDYWIKDRLLKSYMNE